MCFASDHESAVSGLRYGVGVVPLSGVKLLPDHVTRCVKPDNPRSFVLAAAREKEKCAPARYRGSTVRSMRDRSERIVSSAKGLLPDDVPGRVQLEDPRRSLTSGGVHE